MACTILVAFENLMQYVLSSKSVKHDLTMLVVQKYLTLDDWKKLMTRKELMLVPCKYLFQFVSASKNLNHNVKILLLLVANQVLLMYWKVYALILKGRPHADCLYDLFSVDLQNLSSVAVLLMLTMMMNNPMPSPCRKINEKNCPIT